VCVNHAFVSLATRLSVRDCKHRQSLGNRYSHFGRTYPTDRPSAAGSCALWQELGYETSATVFISDASGNAFSQEAERACLQSGVVTVNIPYYTSNVDSIHEAMVRLAAARDQANVRVALFHIIGGADLKLIVQEALSVGVLGPNAAMLWMVTDGITAGDINALTPELRAAINGSLAVSPVGVLTDSPRWQRFANSSWPRLSASRVNALWPAPWHVSDDFFTVREEGGVLDSSTARHVGTFQYDAVSFIGLMACRIAPHGPLPHDFSDLIMGSLNNSGFHGFVGLTGPVRFEASGDRDSTTVTVQLSNWIVEAGHSAAIVPRATREGTDSTWRWVGGSRDASGIIFAHAGQAPGSKRTERHILLREAHLWPIFAVCLLLLVVALVYTHRRFQSRLKEQGIKHRLLRVSDHALVEAPTIANGMYHLFLSHVWGTGQDQMRVIKQRLLEIMPTLSIFLDVRSRAALLTRPCVTPGAWAVRRHLLSY
jgi:hypothetical protein